MDGIGVYNLVILKPEELKWKMNMWFIVVKLVSEWLLFNANSSFARLYHGENKVSFQWVDDEVLFVLDQHA